MKDSTIFILICCCICLCLLMSGIVGYVYYSQKCELNTYCDKEFAGNDVEIKSCKNHLEFGELIFANPLTKEALREDISNIKNPDKYVEAVNRGIDIFKNGKMSCKKKIVFSGLMIGLIFSTSKGLIKSNKNDPEVIKIINFYTTSSPDEQIRYINSLKDKPVGTINYQLFFGEDFVKTPSYDKPIAIPSDFDRTIFADMINSSN